MRKEPKYRATVCFDRELKKEAEKIFSAYGGIFNPIVQSVLNKKFTNAPIISPMLKEVEATRQYNNNTALVYRALGQTFGISPLKLEHFTKGYLGYAEFYPI